MTKFYNKYLIFFLLFALQCVAYSCIEDPTSIGEELLPSTDFFNIYHFDTLKMHSYTVSYDDMQTSQSASSFLGAGYDPYFGTTTAEFVTQLRLSTSSYTTFPYYIDSVVLVLKVENLTGSGKGPHYLSFYEIADDIYKDSTYYATSEVAHTGMSVSKILLPELNVGDSTMLRLDIPNTFAEYLVRQPQYLTHHIDSAVTFTDFFKGLHFKLESPVEQAFLEFSLDPPDITLDYSNYFMVYMTDTVEGGSATLRFILDATNENARFNIFHTDASTAEYMIDHIDDEYPDTLTYISRWGSVTTKVYLNDLERIKNDPQYDNISITKARLIYPVKFDGSYYKETSVPDIILMKYYTSDGNTKYVPDYSLLGSSFYSGSYKASAGGFVFNIPTYVQEYLDDESNNITPLIELTVLQNVGNSVILRSNDNTIASPILEISYIK